MPWVDREELTAANLKIATLEVELEHARKVLAADAALIESQEKQITELEKQAHSGPPPADKVVKFGARPTLQEVIEQANVAAEQNALKGGQPIATQLAQARAKVAGFRRKMNG